MGRNYGQGSYRNQPNRQRKPQWNPWFYRIAMGISAAVFLYAAIRLGAYIVRSIQTRNTNAALQAMHGTDEATEIPVLPEVTDTPAPVAVSTEEQQETAKQAAAATAIPSVTAVPSGELLSRYQYVGITMLDNMRDLYRQNSDLVGWLSIDGICDLPVVYKDNSYYLTHDFNKKTNTGGTLFMDVNHPFEAETQMLVIHGHNMHDGTMFGMLTHFKRLANVQSKGVFTFSSLYRKEVYAVFAVLVVPSDSANINYVPFIGTPSYYSANAFNEYISTLRSRSMVSVPLDVGPSDAILTMSTCLDEDRLLVVARRMRSDETEEGLKSSLRHAVSK